MMDANNAWVAGSDGESGVTYRLLHESGKWMRVPGLLYEETFAEPLWAMSVISDNNVWVVGDDGLIAQKLGTAWRAHDNQQIGAHLRTIQMFGNGEEGWAAGYREIEGLYYPVLLHYTGGRWQVDNSIQEQSAITGLHFAPGAGWLVTSRGTIYRYSNGSWTRETEPQACGENYPSCFGTFNAVRAISADEAWAAGSRRAICPQCSSLNYAVHRANGVWTRSLPDQPVAGYPPTACRSEITSVHFTNANDGLAVGTWMPCGANPGDYRPLIYRSRNGWWYFEVSPVLDGKPNSVSMYDVGHTLVVGDKGLIMSYGYAKVPQSVATRAGGPTPTPTPRYGLPVQRVPDPNVPGVIYFSVVGHTLRGPLREYWEQHGGLQQFGYPLTEAFQEQSDTDGKTYTVQYFERNRFELHPENQPPYDVLLGLLGHTVTKGRENEQPFRPLPPNPGKGGPLYFRETGHFMAPQFTEYWLSHGGLPVYGYPISEAFNEVSPTDGKAYVVQYFERNRFEYHPELPEQFRVSLGLLGVDVLRARGWLP
jgi:hypothetical protein